MRIAIDFDNTIVEYGPLFARAARSLGYAIAADDDTKDAVRARLRSAADGETKWRRIQALVYGPALADARPFVGLSAFLATARASGARLFVVSHKSRFATAAVQPFDLHRAATAWLIEHDLIGARGFDVADVYYEATREAKIARVASLGATHMIDDLAEVFAEPTFPRATQRLLFTPGHSNEESSPRRYASWTLLREALFAAVARDERAPVAPA